MNLSLNFGSIRDDTEYFLVVLIFEWIRIEINLLKIIEISHSLKLLPQLLNREQ